MPRSNLDICGPLKGTGIHWFLIRVNMTGEIRLGHMRHNGTSISLCDCQARSRTWRLRECLLIWHIPPSNSFAFQSNLSFPPSPYHSGHHHHALTLNSSNVVLSFSGETEARCFDCTIVPYSYLPFRQSHPVTDQWDHYTCWGAHPGLQQLVLPQQSLVLLWFLLV